MTTMDVALIPGLCPCGEVASQCPGCEYRPAGSRRLAVCPVCHEFTRDPELCEHRLPEPPPMPETALTVPLKSCGHLYGEDCKCGRWVGGGRPRSAGVPDIRVPAAYEGWS